MSKSNGDHLLALIRAEYPNYHPLVSMAHIAHNEDADLRLQFECHKTISRFIEPELKSVETQTDENQQRRVVISMFPDKPATIENGETYLDYEEVDDLAEKAHNNDDG